MARASRPRRKPLRITRDLVSYVVGLSGIIWEAVRNGTERPSLLLVFAAMIALPKVLDRDEKAAEQPPPAETTPPAQETTEP